MATRSAGRGSVGQLNARYEQELNVYLEMYSYDSDRIFYLANEYMLLNNYHRANKIFLKDNKDIKNVFGAATTYRFMAQNENAIQKYTQAKAPFGPEPLQEEHGQLRLIEVPLKVQDEDLSLCYACKHIKHSAVNLS